MADVIVNNSATALGLRDTSVVYHVASGLGGMMVIDPDYVSAEIIGILESAGDISISSAEEPTNDELPEITGDVIVGETLTASPGVWTGNPVPIFSYQWKADGTDIEGATGQEYELTADEIGAEITVVVTATSLAGEDSAESDPTDPVVGREAPANTVAPVASGDAEIGAVLEVTDGVWTGVPTPVITYQWQVSDDGLDGWADIEGETANEYTVLADDEDKYIMCVVTATNSEGSDSVGSNVIGPIVDPEA